MVSDGKEYSIQLLSALIEEARARGLNTNRLQNWPFKNTVLNDEEAFILKLGRGKNKTYHKVEQSNNGHEANKADDLGGIFLRTLQATLYGRVQPFFRGSDNQLGDLIYFQGHSSPGIYARSFLEGRLTKKQIENFRKKSMVRIVFISHPWLMPNYWQSLQFQWV